MTTSSTFDHNQLDSSLSNLAGLLNNRGVHSVMVIDDSLDAVPEQWKDLSAETRDDIQNAIEDSLELEEWLKEKDLLPPDSVASSRADKYLDNLASWQKEREDLRAIWLGYIESQPVRAARKVVDELVRSLEGLGIEVLASGILTSQNPPDDLSIIFIDYDLDESNSDDMAAASIREINRIYGNLQHSSKPIVVLMSNKETLSPELKLRFREQTKIMPGMFFGFHKDDLKEMRLHVILYDIADNWRKALALQTFIDEITKASNSAAEAVALLVEGLTLEDFALIQLLSLNADGQPLGEYVLWLIGVYFKQQLGRNDEVQNSQGAVDRMVFATPPITEWGPSDSFLAAYRAAVFADADHDLSSDRYPPLDGPAKAVSGDLDNIVALHFGDVFVEDEGDSPTAYVVLTPECDLVFGGARPFPHNRSVVLMPGKMINELPFKSVGNGPARTELVHWKGKDWKIEWRIKRAETITLGKFKAWVQQKDLRRVGRIEFSFAAAIQSVYAANLTRIGLPVMPPQFQPHHTTVYVENWNKALIPVTDTIHNGAYLISSPQLEERQCILSDQLLIELQRSLPEAMELAKESPTEEDLEKIPEGHRVALREAARARVTTNTANLETFSGSSESIIALRGPHELDKPIEVSDVASITITSKAKEAGYHAKTVLTIHLESPEGELI